MSKVIVHCSVRNIPAPDGLYLNADDLVAAFKKLSEGAEQEDRLTEWGKAMVRLRYQRAAERIQEIIDTHRSLTSEDRPTGQN